MTLPCVRSQTLLSSTAVNLPPLEQSFGDHYKNVIMGEMASLKPVSWLFAQPFVQAQIKEHIKASRHWPLWGESTDDQWFPLTKGQLRGKWFHLKTSPWLSLWHEEQTCWRTGSWRGWSSHCARKILVSTVGYLRFTVPEQQNKYKKKCDDIITYNHAPSASGWTPNCDTIAICHGVGGVIKVFCRWRLMQDECTYWFSSDGIKLYVLNNVP